MDYLSLGQSNDYLEVIDNKSFIKKSSKNNRLKNQYEKHIEAISLGLTAPRIINNFNDSSYTMEYINGIPIGFYLKTYSLLDCKPVIDNLIKIIENIFNMSKNGNIKKNFKDKMNDLSKKYISDDECPLIIKNLYSAINSELDDVLNIKGWNHGDLSFENILIIPDTKDVILIDFLDSPFESPLIDLGRIWLDSNFGWWGQGVEESPNSLINLNYLTKRILDFSKKNNINKKNLYIFSGFAILRIYPYTKDPVRIAFLKKAAHEILEDM